jgi:hypothetical protein
VGAVFLDGARFIAPEDTPGSVTRLMTVGAA